MAMSPYRVGRENDKFVETSEGATAIRVQSIGEMLSGITYDAVVASYPNSTTEVYSYKTGGASGTLVATVTVVYTDSTKASLSSVVRT